MENKENFIIVEYAEHILKIPNLNQAKHESQLKLTPLCIVGQISKPHILTVLWDVREPDRRTVTRAFAFLVRDPNMKQNQNNPNKGLYSHTACPQNKEIKKLHGSRKGLTHMITPKKSHYERGHLVQCNLYSIQRPSEQVERCFVHIS